MEDALGISTSVFTCERLLYCFSLWLNAINAATVSMSNSNQQKEAVLKLLQQCADDSIEDNNKSNTFNVILAGSLFHTL